MKCYLLLYYISDVYTRIKMRGPYFLYYWFFKTLWIHNFCHWPFFISVWKLYIRYNWQQLKRSIIYNSDVFNKKHPFFYIKNYQLYNIIAAFAVCSPKIWCSIKGNLKVSRNSENCDLQYIYLTSRRRAFVPQHKAFSHVHF